MLKVKLIDREVEEAMKGDEESWSRKADREST